MEGEWKHLRLLCSPRKIQQGSVNGKSWGGGPSAKVNRERSLVSPRKRTTMSFTAQEQNHGICGFCASSNAALGWLHSLWLEVY